MSATETTDIARAGATWLTHYRTALMRRTALQPPAVRQLLEQRLGALPHVAPPKPNPAAALSHPPRPSDSLLTDLTHTLEQRFGQDFRSDPLAPPAELQTLRQFRTTWTTLSVDRQVTQALAAAPENAGPLNSHFLALRTLSVLRGISPDYLNRFVSYLDALLCLDHAISKGKLMTKKSSKSKAGKR